MGKRLHPLWTAPLVVAPLVSAPARAIVFGTACGDRLPLLTAVVIDVTSVHEGAPRRVVAAHCSGVFVRPDVVLTAAHCLDARGVVGDEEVVDLRFAVSFGEDLRSLTELPGDAVVVAGSFVDPAFSFDALAGAAGIDNDLDDVALLFFAVPVVDDDSAFAVIDDVGVDRAGLPVVTGGYGATVAAGTDIGARTCGDAFLESVADFEQQVGFGAGSVRACNGDSGGPLVADVDGDAVVVGVHSHTLSDEGCAAPSVAARTAPAFAALDDAARAACDDGVRFSCDPPGLPARVVVDVDAGVVVDAGFVDAGVSDAGFDDAGVGDQEPPPDATGCPGCAPAFVIAGLPLLWRRRRDGA